MKKKNPFNNQILDIMYVVYGSEASYFNPPESKVKVFLQDKDRSRLIEITNPPFWLNPTFKKIPPCKQGGI